MIPMSPASVALAGLQQAADLAAVVGGFGQILHAAGVPTTPERCGRLAGSIDVARPATVKDLYWLARVTLVSDRAQLEVFDRVFAQVFAGIWDPAEVRGDSSSPAPSAARRGQAQPGRARDDHAAVRQSKTPTPSLAGDDGASESDEDRAESVLAAVSSDERLRNQEFASMTVEELIELRALMSRLALAPPLRRVRRTARHRHGASVDMRATMQRSLRTNGEPVDLVRRRRRRRPRRLVVLCDISGSMEPYARAYLQLLHSAVGGADAEAFVFATRLTRITKLLHDTNPDQAMFRAGRLAPDWSGGTRIGHAIKSFNDQFGRRGMARNAVIVVVSDGWERDDPNVLGTEMERLSLVAHRIIWVNPRKAASNYQPSAGGMAAALPHVDVFVSGHSLGAIDQLLDAIAAD